ncbi:SDR family oxidoreductase [Cupriavidus basilensis]
MRFARSYTGAPTSCATPSPISSTKTGRSLEAEARAELAARNPQRRLVQPNEVADAVAWLCRPSASAVTGQAIAVAGGEVTG